MTRVTERDVIEETIKHFRKRYSFTSDQYHDNGTDSPGNGHIHATCAIGGVEQAIWQLTGKDVSGDRYAVAKVRASRRRTLYANVMRRLNRIARELFPKSPPCYPGDEGDRTEILEDITFWDDDDENAKKRVQEVLRTALKELS